MMSGEEAWEFVQKNGRYPDLGELHKAPITWIPTKPSNPSKLQAHKFANGKWIPLSHVRFVEWPEMFPPKLKGRK